MDYDVIICIIGANEAETAINNLIEFGINENNISLVMKSESEARKIINDGGPLAGSNMENLRDRLISIGASEEEIRKMFDSLKDNCLLGIQTGINDTELVKQTIEDYRPVFCQVYTCK